MSDVKLHSPAKNSLLMRDRPQPQQQMPRFYNPTHSIVTNQVPQPGFAPPRYSMPSQYQGYPSHSKQVTSIVSPIVTPHCNNPSQRISTLRSTRSPPKYVIHNPPKSMIPGSPLRTPLIASQIYDTQYVTAMPEGRQNSPYNHQQDTSMLDNSTNEQPDPKRESVLHLQTALKESQQQVYTLQNQLKQTTQVLSQIQQEFKNSGQKIQQLEDQLLSTQNDLDNSEQRLQQADVEINSWKQRFVDLNREYHAAQEQMFVMQTELDNSRQVQRPSHSRKP